MKRLVQLFAVAALVSLPFAASAHHHLRHDFYVYDYNGHAPIAGAVVTVFYMDGMVSGETGSPQGNVRFRLPGEYEWVEVTVEADGYCPVDTPIRLGFRPHVGGNGIWIGMSACATVQ